MSRFRKEYRELTLGEREWLADFKDAAEDLAVWIDLLPSGRYKALAHTHLETAVMFAVKEITT